MTKQVEAVKAVRDMGSDELHDHVQAQRRRLLELRFQQATGQVEDHRQLRYVRREVARALTIARENALGINQDVAAPAAPVATAAIETAPRRRVPSLRRPRAAAEEQPAVEPIGDNEPEEEQDVSLSEIEPGEEEDAEDTVSGDEAETETDAAEDGGDE